MICVSFAMTVEAFADYTKTETRRFWKPEYAKRFKPGTVFMGITKDFRRGGERIHMAQVMACYLERLGDIEYGSFIREGGYRYWAGREAYIEAMGGADRVPFVLLFKHISPWATPGDLSSAWLDQVNRLRRVKDMEDPRTLRAALAWRDTQKTVCVAIERKLRKLGARVETLPQKTKGD